MPQKDKIARAAYMREWNRRNVDKVRAKNLKYKYEHREELRIKSQKYLNDNRADIQARDRARGKRPERIAQVAANNKAYRAINGWRKWVHGIDENQYDLLVDAQDGKCMVCGRIPDPNASHTNNLLQIDHSHKTDVRRDLLCSSCNRMLGCVNDDPTILRAGADYLDRWSAIND